jgi:hypothetical protein
MLEKDVERRLVAQLKKLGILHVKMTPTAQRGWPDRMLCLPGSRVLWIEFKAPGRENNLSPNQIIVHEKLRKLGHHVLVSSSVEECLRFINGNLDPA